MRIVFVTESDLTGLQPVGGAETSMVLLAQALAVRGHDVEFVHEIALKQMFPTVLRAHVGGIRGFGIVGIRRTSASRILKPLDRFRKRFNRRHALRTLKARIEQADLVYSSYQRNVLSWISEVLADAHHVRWVIRIGGLDPIRQIERTPSLLATYRRSLAAATALNYNHPGLQPLFEEQAEGVGLEVPPCRVIAGDIGVELPEARIEAQKQSGDLPLKLAMVARFSKDQKRHDLLCEAVALMTEPAELVFIGSGPTLPSVQRLAEDLGVAEQIVFVPPLPQQRMWELLASCSLLCVATDYEGLSKVALESMGLGVPVLASQVRPITDFLEHDVSGFLVRNDSSSWAIELDRLARAPELRRQVAVNARGLVEREYDARRRILELEETFSSLLQG